MLEDNIPKEFELSDEQTENSRIRFRKTDPPTDKSGRVLEESIKMEVTHLTSDIVKQYSLIDFYKEYKGIPLTDGQKLDICSMHEGNIMYGNKI